jgi:hypothetical protein
LFEAKANGSEELPKIKDEMLKILTETQHYADEFTKDLYGLMDFNNYNSTDAYRRRIPKKNLMDKICKNKNEIEERLNF